MGLEPTIPHFTSPPHPRLISELTSTLIALAFASLALRITLLYPFALFRTFFL